MSNFSKLIVICQGKCCRKNGANKVLQTFKENQTENFEIRTKYCFGKCGNGPMVLVLPEEIWYSHVKPEQVPLILN